MWSVKCVPKPGFARISARRSSLTAVVDRVVLISMDIKLSAFLQICDAGQLMAVAFPGQAGKASLDGQCTPQQVTVSPVDRGNRHGSAGYSRGDGVADLGGTPGGAGRALGEVGQNGRLDRCGSVGVPQV